MAMVGVDSGSLYRWSQSLSRLACLGSAGTWRCSTFIKWTGWTLAMALPWWQHHKHCLGYHYIIIWDLSTACLSISLFFFSFSISTSLSRHCVLSVSTLFCHFLPSSHFPITSSRCCQHAHQTTFSHSHITQFLCLHKPRSFLLIKTEQNKTLITNSNDSNHFAKHYF